MVPSPPRTALLRTGLPWFRAARDPSEIVHRRKPPAFPRPPPPKADSEIGHIVRPRMGAVSEIGLRNGSGQRPRMGAVSEIGLRNRTIGPGTEVIADG